MANDPIKTNNPGPPYLGVNMNETQMATHTNWKVISENGPRVGRRVRLKWMPSGIIFIGTRKDTGGFAIETSAYDSSNSARVNDKPGLWAELE